MIISTTEQDAYDATRERVHVEPVPVDRILNDPFGEPQAAYSEDCRFRFERFDPVRGERYWRAVDLATGALVTVGCVTLEGCRLALAFEILDRPELVAGSRRILPEAPARRPDGLEIARVLGRGFCEVG